MGQIRAQFPQRMSDIFTKAKRSEVMARIRSAGNRSTELHLLSLLRKSRISGWRRGVVLRIAAKPRPFEVCPDFVFADQRVAVFVDGCFWHGCPMHFQIPQTRRDFWKDKIESNRRRDRRVNRILRRHGWHVLRIWEHSLTRLAQSMVLARIRRSVCLDEA